jgi:hypothetical protein
MSKGLRRWILIWLVVAYWIVGFYPFQLDLPVYIENAAIQKPDGTLSFRGPGLARTSSPPDWLNQIVAGSSFHIDLKIRSYESLQHGPDRVFTLSKGLWERNLTIAQEGADLIIRCRRPGSTLNGMPPFVVKDVFLDETWHHVGVRFENAVFRVFVDENEQIAAPLGPRALVGWNPNYQLALGNELRGHRGWLGEIRSALVHVGDTSQDYAHVGALDMPQGWWQIPLRLRYLVEFNLFPQSSASDRFINVLGFIPVGIILLLVMGSRATSSIMILFSCVLSLSIELGQLFIDERYPSAGDLLLNIIGAMVGFYTLRAYTWLRARGVYTGVHPFLS